MGNSIIVTKNDIYADQELRGLFKTPISLLDPFHPQISPEAKTAILKARYHDQLIADGLETGHFFYDQNQNMRFQTKQPLHSIAGFIFEAFAVRIMNEDMLTVGRKAFEWCTKRQKTKADYISQFKAIGTGFITTKQTHPGFYIPQHVFDVQFLRTNKDDIIEPATVLGTTNPAGIQIKAITGSEKQEIILPLYEGKYTNVLTFLRHSDHVHSYEYCMRIIDEMYRAREIHLSEKDHLQSCIYSPEMIGIDQRDVDEYFEYIFHWFNGQAQMTEDIYEGIGLEVKGFKYSNGVLIPDK